MRPLALLLLLFSVTTWSKTDIAPDVRKAQISAAAAQAADGMKRYENYVPYLKPIPDRLLSVNEMTPYVLFAAGWSVKLPEGVWSLDKKSLLYVTWEPGSPPDNLFIHGKYFEGEEQTRLLINGQLVNEGPLKNLTIKLPDLPTDDTWLVIELQHLNPLVPAEVNPSGSTDPRSIKFELQQIRVW